MTWSWKIGAFRGIAVRVHATFLLLLTWILMSHLLGGQGIRGAVGGVAFIILLFGCVVLHEFGHALTAQRYGVRTRDITLYPIGGIARLERIPRDPHQELWIALAGPAVNVVIALLIFAGLAAGHAWIGGPQIPVVGGNLATKLMWINLLLAGFNLLPAFPMDGGRVLRAFLAGRMEYGRATQVAASVGQAMAFLFGFIGLFFNPFLLFIAFFVYVGAGEEAASVQAELAFRGVPARRAMMTRFETLSPADTLSVAMDQLLAGAQNDFPVVDGGRLVGILTRTRLFEALRAQGASAAVAQAMLPDAGAVAPGESLESAFQRMRESQTQSLPVVESGRLVGLLTAENIAEFLMLRQALDGRAGAPPAGPAATLPPSVAPARPPSLPAQG
jgi:Zn-dependent protease/CBS domain-containing protein